MFASLRHWIQASRPLAQLNIAPPILLGHAAAWRVARTFDREWLLISLAWGVAWHLYVVFSNDVADAETDTQTRTLLSGGSGVLTERKIEKGQLRAGARMAAGSAILIAIACALLDRPWVLALTAAGFLIVWVYDGAPRRSHRGGGEWLQGLGVGGVLPSLGYYVQAAGVAPWWLLAPAILAGTAGNVITAIPDVTADRAARKRTMPVRLGVRRASLFAALMLWASATLSAIASPGLSQQAQLAIATVALAAPACLVLLNRIFALAVALASVHISWLLVWMSALAGFF